MGTQLPRKKGTLTPTQFLAHVYCGQTARWIKMPLVTEVNLGPGDVVLDGVAAPSKRGTAPPVFHSCLLWPNGWMDEDTTWYGSRPRYRPHCVRRGPSSPRKGHSSPPPLFGPCLLWPRSPISATDELLFMNHSVHAKMLKLLGTSTGAPPLDPTGDFHPPDHLSRASQKSCIRPWKNSILSFVTKRH